MRIAAGSVMFVNISRDQWVALQDIFCELTPRGWRDPDWLVALGEAIVVNPP